MRTVRTLESLSRAVKNGGSVLDRDGIEVTIPRAPELPQATEISRLADRLAELSSKHAQTPTEMVALIRELRDGLEALVREQQTFASTMIELTKPASPKRWEFSVERKNDLITKIVATPRSQ
jgi:hypothetical protein